MIDIEEQYDKIYRYCYFKLKNQHLAEDITQETFLRFLRAAVTRIPEEYRLLAQLWSHLPSDFVAVWSMFL